MRSSRISCYNEQHTSQELKVSRSFCLLFPVKKEGGSGFAAVEMDLTAKQVDHKQ